MALAASNVAVAVTGAVYFAPSATAIPNDAYEALNVAFLDVGYISEEGVTETQGTETNDITAWQNGAVVRRVQTSHVLSYQFTMIETNPNSMELYYGNYALGVSQILGDVQDRRRFVLDVVDGTDNIRTVIPDGQVTEFGDIVYVNGDAIGRQVTVTAYPETSTNVKAYVYLGGTLSA
jgi:hypothetical protein